MWGDPELDRKTSIKTSKDRNGLVAANPRGGRRKHSFLKRWMTHFKTPYATVARDWNDYQLTAWRAISSQMSHVIVVYVSPQLARSLLAQELCAQLLLLQTQKQFVKIHSTPNIIHLKPLPGYVTPSGGNWHWRKTPCVQRDLRYGDSERNNNLLMAFASTVILGLFLFLPAPFMCFEMGPPLRREEWLDFASFK
jgi:hypothetical protein